MRKPPLPQRSPPSHRSLADVYLDGKRVHLMGDPAPRVAAILAAGGRPAQGFQVVQGRSAADKGGKRLDAHDRVDRLAEPTIPIYLTSSPLGSPPGRKPDAADKDPAQASKPIPPVMVELPGDNPEPELRGPLPRGLDPDASGDAGGAPPRDRRRREGRSAER